MTEKVEAVIRSGTDLSFEERNLLSAAYKNAVGSRRRAWRVAKKAEAREKKAGNVEGQTYAKEYRKSIEEELDVLCSRILSLLDEHLIYTAVEPESKVFYRKMKADYWRYQAEYRLGDAKEKARTQAEAAYRSAEDVAVKHLAVTNPVRLGLLLNYSVFLYEVLKQQDRACDMAQEAFELAVEDMDNVTEDWYEDSTPIMKVLRDNLLLWTSSKAGA